MYSEHVRTYNKRILIRVVHTYVYYAIRDKMAVFGVKITDVVSLVELYIHNSCQYVDSVLADFLPNALDLKPI